MNIKCSSNCGRDDIFDVRAQLETAVKVDKKGQFLGVHIPELNKNFGLNATYIGETDTFKCGHCGSPSFDEINPRCILREESILWNIIPSLAKDGDTDIITLEWGWTAGMPAEELAELADDTPKSRYFVSTEIENAKRLRDELDRLINNLRNNGKQKQCTQ